MESVVVTCDLCEKVCVRKLLQVDTEKLKFTQKCAILKIGRSTPALKELRNEKPPGLNSTTLDRIYKRYDWLTGCIHTKRLFCFTCVMFAFNTIRPGNGYKIEKIASNVYSHSTLKSHLFATVRRLTLEKQIMEKALVSLPIQKIEMFDPKAGLNCQLFCRLIDIFCCISKQGEFHEENRLACNSNIQATLELVSKYDHLLKSFLELGIIRSNLIWGIASALNDQIKREIHNADFVALIVEGTSDINNPKQLALILRYYKEAELVERFVKYIDVGTDYDPETLSSLILEVLERFDCLSKVIAQTYDGVAFLSPSEINVIQAMVRLKCPQAITVWCAAHNMNFSLCKSCEHIPEIKRFFSLVKSIAEFFHHHPKGQEHYINNALDKGVTNTDWTYGSQIFKVILTEHEYLIKLFEDMELDCCKWDGETLIQVSCFLNAMKDSQFVFLLLTFSDIFAATQLLSDTLLETSSFEIAHCAARVEKFVKCIKDYKESAFESNYKKSTSTYGLPKINQNKGQENRGKAYFQQIFEELLENILIECSVRFQNIEDLHIFELLASNHFSKYVFKDDYMPMFERVLANLLKNHTIVDPHRLAKELRVIYPSKELYLPGYKIIKFIYNSGLSAMFPEFLKLGKLVVTNPAYRKPDETSTLLRIRDYLDSTRDQKRRPDLTMMSIERKLLTEIEGSTQFYDDVQRHYTEKDSSIDLVERRPASQ